jgi:hypothetical protein
MSHEAQELPKDYRKAIDQIIGLRARVAELEQKLKDEAEGHEGWEQEHLRQEGIRCALLRQIMGVCDPDTAPYRIAKQALFIEP